MNPVTNPVTNPATSDPSGDLGLGGEVKSGRSMPESYEAETAVLGSMVLDRECIGQVVQLLGCEASIL